MSFSALHKAYDVIFMEMIGEFLYNPAQIVGFYFKVFIIIDPALFLLPGAALSLCATREARWPE